LSSPKPAGVFFGTSAFAVPSLRAFAEAADCRLVVTQPDRPSGRGQHSEPTAVKRAARLLGLPTLEPVRLRDALEPLRRSGAALFAVASYGKIVPQAVLDVPQLGALNVHPSLLPLYRGATPLQSQIRDGVRRSGVTVILMDAGMDTGDIVLQEPSAIGEWETYGELHDRFAQLGARLLAQAVALAAAGKLVRTPQAGRASEADIERTLTHPLTKADLQIDWRWSAGQIADCVRSLSPQPGARAALDGESIKILEARPYPDESADASAREPTPGSILGTKDEALLVATGSGAVAIGRLIPPNRKPMSGREYAVGLVRK
jgi:methionyl-tRNA formyltransferase